MDKLIKKIYEDLRYSNSKISKLHTELKEDFKFEQGKQWDDSDISTLRDAGIKALTINKLRPIIKLITGIERQSRSDFIAFPEGGEDEITSSIVTRLLKNITKNSKVERKMSEQFKDGCIGGFSFIEPFIDYSFDLINGELKWKKLSALSSYFDPDFEEYDMSDARFFIKVSAGLDKETLEMLFPEDTAKINKIKGSIIDFKALESFDAHNQLLDYPPFAEEDNEPLEYIKDKKYDLIDYYYVQLEDKFFVAQQERGILQIANSEEEAKSLAEQIQGIVIKKKVPVTRLAQVVGDQIFADEVCWSYPRWKTIPIFPYFAELITEDIGDMSIRIQGIVRGIKDLQEEFNKRRTQELRHLNSSANSGFDIEENQLSPEEEDKLKKFGSSPGVVIKRKKGTLPLTRISPMPLSQGHAQLAEENAQDLKEASGVNPDLLANDSQSQSGRAILFKQRQGLVMVQEMLDNFGETKRLVGKFIVSQLKELFTVETAMRVLGDAFITDNFTVPVTDILVRGLNKIQEGKENEITELENSVMLQYPNENPGIKPVVDEMGQLVTTVDFDLAIKTINDVLNNAELNKYDVAVGEGPFSETIRNANFTDLKELAQQGVPIPPQTLIEMSMIPSDQKGKILKQLAAQQQAAMTQTQQAQPSSAEGE